MSYVHNLNSENAVAEVRHMWHDPVAYVTDGDGPPVLN